MVELIISVGIVLEHCRICRTVLGSGRLYHISRTSTGTLVDCVVLIGQVLGHCGTVLYQQDWYWVSSLQFRINRMKTGAEMYYIVYVGLVCG